jgi:hypothetical protein
LHAQLLALGFRPQGEPAAAVFSEDGQVFASALETLYDAGPLLASAVYLVRPDGSSAVTAVISDAGVPLYALFAYPDGTIERLDAGVASLLPRMRALQGGTANNPELSSSAFQTVSPDCEICREVCETVNSPEANAVTCTLVGTGVCGRVGDPRKALVCSMGVAYICNAIGTYGCPAACEKEFGCPPIGTCDPDCQRVLESGRCRDTCPGERKCENGQCICPEGKLPCGDIICCENGQCCENGTCVTGCGRCQTCHNGECRDCAYARMVCNQSTGQCEPCKLKEKCEVFDPDTLTCVDGCAKDGKDCCPTADGPQCCDEGEFCCNGACVPELLADCNRKVYCNCNKTCYDDPQDCLDNCKATLGCFSGICDYAAPGQC